MASKAQPGPYPTCTIPAKSHFSCVVIFTHLSPRASHTPTFSVAVEISSPPQSDSVYIFVYCLLPSAEIEYFTLLYDCPASASTCMGRQVPWRRPCAVPF